LIQKPIAVNTRTYDRRMELRIMTYKATNKRLMLVDDEPDIIKVMKSGLEANGFVVDAFTDPKQALEHFKPNYYTRVITDIRMPSMTGFELARELWAKDENTDICFLSSFEIYADEARKVMPSLRSECFVKKPIAPSALAQHIKAHEQLA